MRGWLEQAVNGGRTGSDTTAATSIGRRRFVAHPFYIERYLCIYRTLESSSRRPHVAASDHGCAVPPSVGYIYAVHGAAPPLGGRYPADMEPRYEGSGPRVAHPLRLADLGGHGCDPGGPR